MAITIVLFSVHFQAILSDLFPGVSIPEHDYGILQEEIEEVIANKHLIVVKPQVKKIIQFYETLEVRHGVMLVGPTGGGKTTILQVRHHHHHHHQHHHHHHHHHHHLYKCNYYWYYGCSCHHLLDYHYPISIAWVHKREARTCVVDLWELSYSFTHCWRGSLTCHISSIVYLYTGVGLLL